MTDHPEFGNEAERDADQPKDYPALIDAVVEEAESLLRLLDEPRDGSDDELKTILLSMVETGDLARKALKHGWGDEG